MNVVFRTVPKGIVRKTILPRLHRKIHCVSKGKDSKLVTAVEGVSREVTFVSREHTRRTSSDIHDIDITHIRNDKQVQVERSGISTLLTHVAYLRFATRTTVT